MKKIGMIFAVLALSACGIPQSQACKDVMALTDDDCTGGQSIADSYTSTDAYEEGGTCWTNAETAKACTDACQASLDSCTDAGGGDAGT